ncbi:MAG: CDP-alcohol phosphatidyltransferase family protein [Alphaproteobacteria bacterium]
MTRHIRHVPNLLTGLRLVAAPAIALLLYSDRYRLALAVFILAGITDLVDGYLAKRYNSRTRLGRYLDPIADKALMFACFVMLSYQGVVSWYVTGVVIGRDILMVLAVIVARMLDAPLTVRPLPIGKLTMVVQVSYIAVELVALAFYFDIARWQPWLGLIVGIVTILSGWAYGGSWVRAMRRLGRSGTGAA